MRIISLLCLMFLLGCNQIEPEVAPTQAHREFFRLTTDEQFGKFHDYDMNTQYELLIIGNQIVHPPLIFLTREFAKNGAPAVPFLHDKLASAKNEMTIRDIANTFTRMQDMCLYDVGMDASLMNLLENRAAAMQGQWKSTTQSMIETLRKSTR